MKHLVSAALLAPVLAACASVVDAPPNEDPYIVAMPPGEGREILASVCTECHDLGGIEGYKGYWGEEEWRDMVATMVEHGARLDDQQATVLVDYLTEHFGPDAP